MLCNVIFIYWLPNSKDGEKKRREEGVVPEIHHDAKNGVVKEFQSQSSFLYKCELMEDFIDD